MELFVDTLYLLKIKGTDQTIGVYIDTVHLTDHHDRFKRLYPGIDLYCDICSDVQTDILVDCDIDDEEDDNDGGIEVDIDDVPDSGGHGVLVDVIKEKIEVGLN